MSDLTIYINGNFLYQRVTGVQRFSIEVCKVLVRRYPNIKIITLKGFKVPSWLPEHSRVEINGWFSGVVLRYWVYWVYGPLWVRFFSSERNAVWSPAGLCSPLWSRHIVTIHDMAFKFNPNWFSFRFNVLNKLFFPLLLNTAMRITTVSRFSRREIRRYYPWVGEIAITGNGVAKMGLSLIKYEVKPSGDFPQIFLLSVASVDPRKNTALIVEAWKRLPSPIRGGVGLVLVGGGAITFKDLATPQEEASFNIHYLGYVADGELAWLYRNAKCLVLASSYEGFGLPVIESLLYKLPVVCSDIPAFREVGAGMVSYFKVGDVDDLAHALYNVITKKREGVDFESELPSWDTAAEIIYNLAQKCSVESRDGLIKII